MHDRVQVSLHTLSRTGQRTPSDEAAQILLRAHLDARSYRPCHATAPALVVPAALSNDNDLRAAAALAVAQSFGLLDPARGAATVELVNRALGGAADDALDRATPDAALAWCIAAAEWCERNGLDREFSRLHARAALADAHPAASPWARVHWRIAAAWHHEAFGRRDDVSAYLEQAQLIAEQASDIGLQVVVWLKRARLSLARQTPAAAVALAGRAAAHADAVTSPLWLADAADVLSRAALVDGDMHRALQQARRTAGFAELAQATPAYTFTYRRNEADALLSLGAWDAAVDLMREMAAIPLPARLTERLELLVMLFELVRDDRTHRWSADSSDSLAHCISRLRELDYPGVLALLPAPVARLWARALQAGIEPDWIRASIRSRDLPSPEPGWPRTWPWALRVEVLGKFNCTTDTGTSLMATAGKAAARPLMLLRRVAADGGYEGVSADAVAKDLWPGDGREGRDKALETTLARLRRLLGHADVVLLHERRLRLNPRRVWLDSAALSREVGRLQGAGNTASAEEIQAAWQEVFVLWRGPPLAGEPAAPWLHTLRQRLRGQLAAALLLHADEPGHRARCLQAVSADPELAELLQARE